MASLLSYYPPPVRPWQPALPVDSQRRVYNAPTVEFLLIRDIFQLFRLMLAVLVTVYFTIVTAQSLWEWYKWLAGSDKYMSMLRRYLIVQGLRLRFKTFWGDVIICLLLCVAFLMLWRAQNLIDDVEVTLREAGQFPRAVQRG